MTAALAALSAAVSAICSGVGIGWPVTPACVTDCATPAAGAVPAMCRSALLTALLNGAQVNSPPVTAPNVPDTAAVLIA